MPFFVINRQTESLEERATLVEALEDVNEHVHAGYSLDNVLLIEGEEVLLRHGPVEVNQTKIIRRSK